MLRKKIFILIFSLFLLSMTNFTSSEINTLFKPYIFQNNENTIIEFFGPILTYYPESHDFGDKYEGQTDNTTFKIWNSGCCYMMYSLIDNCDWVNVSPTSGGVSGSYDNDTIIVSINTSGLELGAYICEILIISNGGNGNFNVTINIVEKPNNPPVSPTIEGPAKGKIGEEYEYSFTSTDPDEDDIFYYIDWGDGQVDEWIGPYGSEKVNISHIWGEKGTYTIKAKAKDNHDAESNWSEPIHVILTANIEIEIKGGFGISIIIHNIGNEDISNLFWSIELSGIIFIGNTAEGFISIPGETNQRIKIIPFGIGPGAIKVSISNISKTVDLYIIGPFVLIN